MVESNQTAKQLAAAEKEERHIEVWKIKRLIKKLQSARGNGTSFVSFYIPPKNAIGGVMNHLNQELAGAENIKNRQTRQSVISAITSTRERLKLYKAIPENGLAIFCGVILMEDNKTEKKVTYDLVPYKPLHANVYKCQNTFYTEPLLALLEDDEKFGFIVMDGNGVLFATL